MISTTKTCLELVILTSKAPARTAILPGNERPIEEVTMRDATCSIEGCGSKRYCRGWCVMHYRRWATHGDPLTNLLDANRRFWSRVRKTDTCWIWTGCIGGEWLRQDER